MPGMAVQGRCMLMLMLVVMLTGYALLCSMLHAHAPCRSPHLRALFLEVMPKPCRW
jgi:hypothetical protein